MKNIFLAMVIFALMSISASAADVTYSESTNEIQIWFQTQGVNLTWLDNQLNNDSLLRNDGTVWYLNSSIRLYGGSILFINETDVSELRMSNTYKGLGFYRGLFYIKNVTVGSWNHIESRYSLRGEPQVSIEADIIELQNVDTYGISRILTRSGAVGNIFNVNMYNGSSEALVIQKLRNASVYNINITNFGGSGIEVQECNDTEFYNINVNGAGDYLNPQTGKYGIVVYYNPFSGIGSYNTTVRDSTFNATGWSGVDTVRSKYTYFTNLTIDNSGHNGLDLHGGETIFVENITINNSVSNGYIAVGVLDSVVSNISILNSIGYAIQYDGVTNISTNNIMTDGDAVIMIDTIDSTYYNVTTDKIVFEEKFGTQPENAYIIDSDIADIYLVHSTNLKVLNTNYTIQRFDLPSNSAEALLYYYVDILVRNTSSEIAFISEMDFLTLSVDGYGNNKTTFQTTSSGHTPLPNTDRANSPAIAEYYRNSDGTYQEFSHTATITTPDDRTVTLTGITPDSSWYREDPNVPTYTITAIIPEIDSTGPHITGFAPSEDNGFNTGDSKIFRVWTDESLDSMNWYLDGSFVSSDSMNYTWVTKEGGHTIIFEGSNTNGAVSQRWDINGGISGVVLAITESFPVDTAPDQNNGSTYEFNVTVNQPLTSSSWYLDGNSIASDTLSLDYTWTHASTHNITFMGSNANGSISETWVVNVNDGSPSSVAITPATQTIAPNQPFTLAIPITPETPIAGAQFDLNFDNSLATVTSVTEGNLLNQDGATTLFNSGTINNGAGTVTNIYVSILGNTSVSSQGSMATISMTAGGTTGHLNLNLSNIIISDANSAAAPYALTNATILIDTAPVLSSIGAKSVDEGSALAFTTGASDVDGDSLTYSATNLPTGASFNTATGAFSWTPADGQAGTYVITFEVTDGYISDSEVVTITVNDANNAPVITTFVPANSLTFNESDVITVGIIASDADGDALTYNIKIDGVTQSTSSSYVWETDYSSAGSHTIDITVSDGIEQVTDSRIITINDVRPRWDVNEDGIVNVLDISRIGQKYGTSVEAPYPRWDVNQDGVINVQDMALTGSHFGEIVV